jgi:hypothetical protein
MSMTRVRPPLVFLILLLLVSGSLALLGCNRDTPRPVVPDPDEGEKVELPEGPLFREVPAAESGVDWSFRNGEEAMHLAILESLGGGIGLIDFDNDGLLDLFIPGGGHFAKTAEELGPRPHQGCAILGYPCKLYRNKGGWKFEDVTDKVLRLDGPWFFTHGSAAADYDRDGWTDLVLTGWGRLALFHNEPADPGDPAGKERVLVDVTKKAGLTTHSWSSSAGWGDLDGDGYPELYVCNYADWSWQKHPQCNYDIPKKDVCPPKQFDGLPDVLFRNNQDGTFTDVSKEAGLKPGGPHQSKALGVLIVDVNGDGKPDVYVANDTVDNYLYINRSEKGKIRLEEGGVLAGVARDSHGGTNGSMGLDAGDPFGTGKPALWVTNYEGEEHGLYENDCAPKRTFFSHRTGRAGISAIGQVYVAWGTGFLDLDHHGWEDLVIADGHAIRYPSTAGVSREEKPVLLRNLGGHFHVMTDRGGEYFRKAHLARGVGVGDLDNDGKIDLVVSHMNAPVALLKNVAKTEGNHWLGVKLAREKHADIVGARVVLEAGGRKQSRFAKGGGSYASSGDRRLVFGLGPVEKVDRVTVYWPDGKVEQWKGLEPDVYHPLVQGKGKAATK